MSTRGEVSAAGARVEGFDDGAREQPRERDGGDAVDPAGDPDDGRSDGARSDDDVDADFRAMLAGIRTTLPGSQVLLAFLLTVPLQAGFAELGPAGRNAFLVSLIATAVASVLLIAPTAHARVRFPNRGLRRRSESHLRVAAWLALLGTIALAVAIAAAMFLSVTLLLGSGWAAVVAAATGLVTVVTWFAIPLWWTLSGE